MSAADERRGQVEMLRPTEQIDQRVLDRVEQAAADGVDRAWTQASRDMRRDLALAVALALGALACVGGGFWAGFEVGAAQTPQPAWAPQIAPPPVFHPPANPAGGTTR